MSNAFFRSIYTSPVNNPISILTNIMTIISLNAVHVLYVYFVTLIGSHIAGFFWR